MNQADRGVTALAAFAAGLGAPRLPDEVRGHAARILFDTVGAIIAGQQVEEVARLTSALAGAEGRCAVVGSMRYADALTSALLHGCAAVSLELDEGCAAAAGHPAAHVVPVLLALGQDTDVSGEELLTALVVGYEIAVRVARATTLLPALGAHGTWMTLGGAAAAARLLTRDPTCIAEAIRIAASALPAALGGAAVFGGHQVRNLAVGLANQHALTSARAAVAGFTAPTDALRRVGTGVLGGEFDDALLNDGLGDRFELLRNYFKPLAACRHLHGALQALAALGAEGPLPPVERVARIEVHTHAVVGQFVNLDPPTTFAARFSLPTALAGAYLGHALDAGEAAWRGHADVRALAARVTVQIDPDAERRYPHERRTRLVLRFTDGSTRTLEQRAAWGDPTRPMSDADLERKFTTHAGPVLGAERTARAVATWRTWGSAPSVRRLMQGWMPG